MTTQSEKETIAVSELTAFLVRAEALERGISEEEMLELVFDEYVKRHKWRFRLELLRRPWVFLRPAARGLIARTF